MEIYKYGEKNPKKQKQMQEAQTEKQQGFKLPNQLILALIATGIGIAFMLFIFIFQSAENQELVNTCLTQKNQTQANLTACEVTLNSETNKLNNKLETEERNTRKMEEEKKSVEGELKTTEKQNTALNLSAFKCELEKEHIEELKKQYKTERDNALANRSNTEYQLSSCRLQINNHIGTIQSYLTTINNTLKQASGYSELADSLREQLSLFNISMRAMNQSYNILFSEQNQTIQNYANDYCCAIYNTTINYSYTGNRVYCNQTGWGSLNC